MQDARLANVTAGQSEWNAVDWPRAFRTVRNLRQRIFRATQAGDWKRVASLQKLLLRSQANRLVSVRRVTQVNQGKRPAGIDKGLVKTPAARGRLVDALATYQPWRAQPTKRVYFPKANSKQRPLGISTMIVRCIQAMVKTGLEPCWEAQFEGSSSGFRPGRVCHDAIGKVYLLARPNKRKKLVVDADITVAFDHIDHAYLLRTIGHFPARALVRQWLRAGYVDRGVFHATETGTPQGGVISPVLANIALHGLEQALSVRHDRRGQLVGPRAVVRYADDLVVFCEGREDAERVRPQILPEGQGQWGLTLSADKTRIAHLTEGFDFLGFTMRHYVDRTTPTGSKPCITPSRTSMSAIRRKLREEWLQLRQLRGQDILTVLRRLNPICRGEANYFRVAVASRAITKLDTFRWHREERYARRSHPNKSTKWRHNRYWGQLNTQRTDHWVFGDQHTGGYLLKFRWFPIRRHVLVKGAASPDDLALRHYWAARRAARAVDFSPIPRGLATRQRGTCIVCGEMLSPDAGDETVEAHHLTPGGRAGPAPQTTSCSYTYIATNGSIVAASTPGSYQMRARPPRAQPLAQPLCRK
jgi:RNA-directed DNA polymerase